MAKVAGITNSWWFVFDFALDAGEIDRSEGIVRELQESDDQKYRNMGDSRAFRLSLESRARELAAEDARTKLWWMDSPILETLVTL